MTGLSLSTLRRRRQALRAHGAIQKEDGSWSIPVHALVDLGMLDRVTVDKEADSDPATDEVADLRVEVERERGLRLAAERELQAITAHLATAQNTIRMIEAAPPKIERVEVPKIETRVERVEVPVEKRVEVPVTPRWLWPALAAAAVLLLLVAILAGWSLTRSTAAAPEVTRSTNQVTVSPTTTGAPPLVPATTDTSVEVQVDPPPRP